MWLVTYKYNGETHNVLVRHKDGRSAGSVCQCLRLVREDLVRQGIEDECLIIRAQFIENFRFLEKEMC